LFGENIPVALSDQRSKRVRAWIRQLSNLLLLTLVSHAGETVLLDVVNPAQIASQPKARLRFGFLILGRTIR
jgi:hypothetical protein